MVSKVDYRRLSIKCVNSLHQQTASQSFNGTSLSLASSWLDAFLLEYFTSYVKTKAHRRVIYVGLKKQCSASLELTQDANVHLQK